MKSNPILGLGVSLLAASVASSALAATTDSVSRQVRGLNDRLTAYENRFRVNGFATFGAVQSDVEESDDTYHRGINNETNFRRYTKAGIQMSFNMDAKTSVVTQFVARGENDFDVKAEWAYFKHQVNNQLSVKVGRLRKPNYLLSEYFDVGYAMPWTQAPVEVYGVLEDSANYEAIDLTYDFEMGDWTAYTQFQFGRSETATAVSDDLMAFNFSMNNGSLTLRAGYSQADAGLVSGTATAAQVSAINSAFSFTDKADEVVKESNKGTFYGLAVMYDNGSLLAIAEYNSLTVESLFPDQDGYYVMGGYRFGQWMPYLSYAHEETTDDDTRDPTVSPTPAVPDANANGVSDIYEAAIGAQQAFNKEQTRSTVGVRYDYKPGIALKLQYDMIDVGETKGEFAAIPAEDSANIISFTIDTVF